jgi:gamma-glutamyltranspeptidase/glutathione hydrolase
MVSTAHYCATSAGAELLAESGNAVDAAVGAAFALCACEPQASGLGGQTMMLIHHGETGATVALDGSSRAPNRAVHELFSDRRFRIAGRTASTVPSTPAVLAYVLDRYGTMPLSRVLEPAIALARNGYQITQLQHKLQRRELKGLKENNGGRFFLRNGDLPCSAGTVFKQQRLADTLQRLAEQGVQDFYIGDIAREIHEDMHEHDGLIQRDDLARIPYPVERRPVTCRFGPMKVYSMPPPGAGRSLVELLSIINRFPGRDRNPDTPSGALLLAEAQRRVQLDRRDRPFDPNFYPLVPDADMLRKKYVSGVSQQIRHAISASGETTHLSVMDGSGSVVSLTQSIERVFGAKTVHPRLGFIYNNYMSAFEYSDMTHPYFLRPNGVPWASVAPTIIFRDKKPWLAIGSPGSERIISTIAQVLIRLAQQSPFDAVAAPRLHCSFDGQVSLEAACMRDDIPDHLRRHGFSIDVREPMSFYLGCVQMVLCDGEYIGVADPRRDGSARGPC